jgi:hypothetical protein
VSQEREKEPDSGLRSMERHRAAPPVLAWEEEEKVECWLCIDIGQTDGFKASGEEWKTRERRDVRWRKEPGAERHLPLLG